MSVRDTNPRLRRAAPAALRVFRDLIAQAGIGKADANRLLDLGGDHPALRDDAVLSEEQLRRIHVLLDITASLRAARDQEAARTWLTTRDRAALQGYLPVQHMIRYGLPGFAEVQRLADAFANE